MIQTTPFEQLVEQAQNLSPVDKVRLIEYLLPTVRQDVTALVATEHGESTATHSPPPDALVPVPERIRAALDLLRAWREEGDPDEQRAALAALRQALPDDFPDTAIKELTLTTTVLPGGKIEISAPDLVPEQTATIVVRVAASPLEKMTITERLARANYQGGSLFQTADDVDTYIRAERDTWER